MLMDRLGNSLDRTILLHKLLITTGHRARLVRGTLTKAEAEEVLKNDKPTPPEGALPVEKETEADLYRMISRYAEKYGLDPAALRNTALKLRIDRQHMAEELAQRVEEQTDAIIELLGEVPDIRDAEWNKAVEALRDHWYLEWRSMSGWIALGPTLPEAKPGETVTSKKALIESPDNLEKKDLHLVTVRVVIERWHDGRLEEEPVLEHALQPSKLFGKRITLRHVPPIGPRTWISLRKTILCRGSRKSFWSKTNGFRF